MLYELVTGAVPFPGASSAVVFDGILHSSPRPSTEANPNLPVAFDAILCKALEKDPDLRCQTAAELRADLKRLKRDLESGRRPAESGKQKTAAAQTAASTSEKSVAVLFFENLGGSKDDEYFRDGMTEDIITELSKIKELQVFSACGCSGLP